MQLELPFKSAHWVCMLVVMIQIHGIFCDALCKEINAWDTRHPNPDGTVTKCVITSDSDLKTVPTDVDGLWLELPEQHTLSLIPGLLPDMPNLEYLKLDITHIKDFPPRLFEQVYMPKLRAIMFSRDLNNVDSKNIAIVIKNHTFSGLNKLENLYLDNLGIQTLEPDALHGLTSLQILDLTLNYLNDIHPFSFQSCKNLTSLKLTDNFISSLEKNSFFGLSHLSNLDISLNKITKLTAGPFHHLLDLELFIANSNNLESIEPNTFNGLSKLHYLSLAKNSLSHLDPMAFHGLTTLESLILDHNKVKLIKGQFANVADMLHLYMAHNDIKEIKAEYFEGLLSLTELVLAANSIEKLETEVFYQLPTLFTLDLSENKISVVETDAFKGLTDLETLNIQDNVISVLPEGSFSDLVQLKSLYMDQNPWVCSCDNAWLILWLRKNFNNIEPNVQFYYILCSENDPIPEETFMKLIMSEHFMDGLECGSLSTAIDETSDTSSATTGSASSSSDKPSSTTEHTKVYNDGSNNKKKAAIIACSIFAALIVILALVIHVYCRKRKQRTWDPTEKKHINSNDMIGHKKVKHSSADPESGYLDIVLKQYTPHKNLDIVIPAGKNHLRNNNAVYYVYENQALSTSLEYIQRVTDINHPKRGDLSDTEDSLTSGQKLTSENCRQRTVVTLEPSPYKKTKRTVKRGSSHGSNLYHNKQKDIFTTNGSAKTSG